MHLGRDRVICAYEIDGLIVDPGPDVVPRHAARPAGPGGAPRAPAHPHPPRPRGGHRACCAGAIRGSRSTCTSAGRRTWSTRRSSSPAPRGSTATTWTSCGARSLPVPEDRITVLGAARPWRASAWPTRRGTPPITSATCTRKRATPSWATWPGCASRRTQYTLAPTPPPDIDVEAWLDSLHTIASWNPQRLVPDPLRPGHRRRGPAAPHPRRRCSTPPTRRGSTARRPSSPRSSAGSREATDPATAETLRAGRAARPALRRASSATGERRPSAVSESGTVELPRTGGPGTGLDGHWRVIVLNDNHNTFDGVAFALSRVLPGVALDQGMPIADHDPQQRAGRSCGPGRRSRPSTTGSSSTSGAHDGSAGAGLASTCSPSPTTSQNEGRSGTW